MNFTADPEIGRFISQDSYRGELNDPGQWHLYTYCANNPINYVDPSGHAGIKWNKQDTYKPQGNCRYTKTHMQVHTGGYGKLRVINRFKVYKKKIVVRMDVCEAIVVKSWGTAEYETNDPISTVKKADEVGEKINVSAVFKRTKSYEGLTSSKSFRLTTYVKIKEFKENGMYVRLGYKFEKIK